MELIRAFKDLSRNDADLAGGKGASLGEMTQAGIPVPPGFVILADAFEQFIQETDLIQEIDTILHSVDHNVISTVESASEKIKGLILSREMPRDIEEAIKAHFANLDATYVAVRSSATAEDGAENAWAGQLESYLNTTEENVIEMVKHCWASLFTPRAIFYRFEKGLHKTKISVAVVVQKMVQSELSGIAFSVHPVTEDYNQLIIESGFGLGEAIVSGSVTPDSYVIEKEPRRIVDKNISYQNKALWKAENGGNVWRDLSEEEGSKPSLSDEQALELAEIILRIEDHYGFPCDVEWAYQAGQFFITQSRPITTLTPKPVVLENPRVAHYMHEPMLKMGQWALKPLDMETWYVQDVSKYFEEFFGFPKCHPNFYRAETGQMSNYAPVSFFDFLFKYIEKLTTEDYKGLEKKLSVFNEIKAETKKELIRISRDEYSDVSIEELITIYTKNRDLIHRISVFDHFGMYAEEYWPARMRKILTEKCGLIPDTPEYHTVLFSLSKPETISTSLEEKRDVLKKAYLVKTGTETIAGAGSDLVRDYGWLPVFTYGVPWDAQHYIVELSALTLRDESALQVECEKLEKYSDIREHEIHSLVEKYTISPEDLQVFVDFGLAVDARNEAEFVVSFAGNLLMPIYKEIAKRLTITETELRMLFEAEIVACLRAQSDPKQLLEGKTKFVAWGFDPSMRERINYSEAEAEELYSYLETHAKLAGQSDGGSQKGVCASSGRATGKARILKGPDDNNKVLPGDILISYATTVDFLPAMKNAGAIVTETGGLTCHAAVVSREFGIPCVVSFKGAMTDFVDGDLIEVDADKGTVKIIKNKTEIKENYEKIELPGLLQVNKYRYFGHYQSLPFALWFWAMWYSKERADEVRFGEKFLGEFLLIKSGHTFVPERTMSEFTIQLEQQINEGISYFEHVHAHADKIYSEAISWADHIDIDPTTLQETFVEFLVHARNIMFFWASGWLRSQAFGVMLQEEAKKSGIAEIDLAEYVEKPDTPMLSQQNELKIIKNELEKRGIWEMLKVDPKGTINTINNSPDLNEMFQLHLKKYDWIEILNFVGNTLTVDKLLDQMTYIKNDQKQFTRKKANDAFEKYAIIANHISYVHQAGAEYFSIFTRKTKILLEAIASNIGVSYNDLLNLTPNEIFENGKLITGIKEKIHRRRDYNVCIFRTSEAEMDIVDDYEIVQNLETQYLPRLDIEHIHSLNGTIGNKGKAIGPVRIILANGDFHKMKEGDVLVAPMTTPDFVVLMQKAAAIVTDMGGLLCHAAIVSRELGKPCVISTNVATRVLNDGDLVEVDADKGIVRIIKKGETDISKKKLNKEDFDLTFESQGTTFIFEDIVRRFYVQKNSVAIQQNGRDFLYTSKKTISELQEIGLNKTVSDTEGIVQKIKLLIEESVALASSIVLGQKISKDIAEKAFLILGNIGREYFYFDFCLWDGAFEKSKTNQGVKENISLVEKYKNAIREELDVVYFTKASLLSVLMAQVSEQMSIPLSDLEWYMYEEVIALFEGNVVSQTDLNERRKGSVYWFDEQNDLRFYFGDKAINFLDRFHSANLVMKQLSVTGKVAHGAGKKVIGTARILQRDYGNPSVLEKSMQEMTKGEILISQTTDPQLMPAFHKASAVVTDVGGMLSHAAISSRELDIPCIVGTKFATQIIKNGDLIEVDADSGTVRVLKSA